MHLHGCHLRLLLLVLLTQLDLVTRIRLQILQVVRISMCHHKLLLLFERLAVVHARVGVVFVDVSCTTVKLDSLSERILH